MSHRAIPTVTLALCLLALGVSTAAAARPAISGLTVSHVTTESAVLQAVVDPEGKPTLYRFEYGPEDCSANPCTHVPVPEGQIKATDPPSEVEVELEGLGPATTYHYRLIAKNGGPEGETKSADRTLSTYPPPPLFGPCPNDPFRAGHPSAALPDCRAYEQASPVDKNGVDAIGMVVFAKASPNGDAVSFASTSGIPGADGSQELPSYLASRGDSDWSTQGLLPPQGSGQEAFVRGWTPDFSQVFSTAGDLTAPGGVATTFLSRSTSDGSLTAIAPYNTAMAAPGVHTNYVGASADGSKVLFETTAKLPGVGAALAAKPNLYLWDRTTNITILADLLNEGQTPPAGAFAGSYDWLGGETPAALEDGGAFRYYTQDQHAVSSSGSIFFTAAKTGQIYLRRNPTEPQSALNGAGECTESAKACTLHVSATEKENGHGTDGSDPAGTRPAAFLGATPDGSRAFLASSEKLTDDATTGPEPAPAAIARADIGGAAGSVDLGFLPAHAEGLAIGGGYIYWANPEAETIGRAKLNGAGNASEADEEFITGADNPQDVAVDTEYVYWTSDGGEGEAGEGTIGRAKLDHSEAPEAEFITGATKPEGIAVDTEHVYWTNSAPNNSSPAYIGRANLAGGEIAQPLGELTFANGKQLSGLAVTSSHLYVMDTNSNNLSRIGCADLEGANYELNCHELFLGETNSHGLTVDGNYVYWTIATSTHSSIGRAKLDGSEKQEFITGAGHPQGLALDAEHIYWSANQEVVPNPGNDLYRYDLDGDGLGSKLTDLTVDHTDPDGADVQGLLGASEDGSYVYFAANGVPDGVTNTPNARGESPVAGTCQGSASAISLNFTGECNLYLAHAGTIGFIARLDANGGESENDAANWLPNSGAELAKSSRVSADGTTLLFRSRRQLGPYDNEGTPELYRYRAGEAGPTCVSCNPTGAAPLGAATLGSINFPTIVPFDPAFTLSRNLSADGNRVFFESVDPLVDADVNGEAGCPRVGTPTTSFPACRDVYEWEAKGSGSCQSETQNGGCLYLLSTGTSSEPSFFADASTSGDDAFLITRSPALVGQDQDQIYDVYDARAEGGLAAQNMVAPLPCEGEACKGAVEPPPVAPSPGSGSFSGPGDPTPKRTHHKKHRKKKHHKRRHRGAKTNRRTDR